MDPETAREFFDQARRDPFLHALTAGHLDAWTHGYLQAAKDWFPGDGDGEAPTRTLDWDAAYERAVEVMRDEQARALVAMATIMGGIHETPRLTEDG